MDTIDRTKTNILVVEDSLTQALLLEEDLAAQGFKVRSVPDGAKAVEALKEQIPAIIISDIEMPVMDGYELCDFIKNEGQYKHVPVILLTSLSDPKEVIKAIICRADAFLTKPYNINLLSSLVDDILLTRKEKDTSKDSNEIFFQGKCYVLPSQESSNQITELLLSTYVSAVQKNKELEEAHKSLTINNLEIKEKNTELSKLNNLKNTFLGMAAHDLRNPLGAIQGYTDLIIQQLPKNFPADYVKMLHRIRDTSSFMLNLVNDLLDISIIESGLVTLDKKEINFPQFVKDNIEINEKLAERKEQHILLDVKDKSAVIVGDPSRLEQVLNNLITNAIKFSHPKSDIEVTIDKDPNQQDVVLAIKDKGIGIEEKDKDELFKTFSKIGKQGTAGEKSTGLGLAIAKKIVTEHKGRIWVDSEPGKGSTFYVALPKKK